MATDPKAELKKMMKEVLEEALNERSAAAASGENDQTSPLSKPAAKSASKTKAKKKMTVFDESRKTENPWTADPRSKESQWPCMGQHTVGTFNNKWGKWQECQKCGLRTSYTPAEGAPSTACQQPHPPNVSLALERLRQMELNPETLDSHTVKSMIKMVAAEYVVNKAKSASSTKNPKGVKNKATTHEPPEIVSDGSFEELESKKTEE